MSYESPDTDDMDQMNNLMERLENDALLLKEAYRVIDMNDKLRPMATAQHVRVLIDRIHSLEQNLLGQVFEP